MKTGIREFSVSFCWAVIWRLVPKPSRLSSSLQVLMSGLLMKSERMRPRGFFKRITIGMTTGFDSPMPRRLVTAIKKQWIAARLALNCIGNIYAR